MSEGCAAYKPIRSSMHMETPKRLRDLEKAICGFAGLRYTDLYSGSRAREIMDARQVVWTVAHQHHGYSLKILASVYGKDYTTIRHGVWRMKATPAYKLVLRELRSKHPHLLDGNYSSAGTVGSWDFKGRKPVEKPVESDV